MPFPVRNRLALLLCALAAVSFSTAGAGEECTAMVASPAATAAGRPMLWKNRDTDKLSNRIVFVREEPHSYLALVDAANPTGRHVYAGLNDVGFAIMNTVAYNLPESADEFADLEGVIMADALRSCRTVADFEVMIRACLGPDLGALTNFGVIDAKGGAAVFETHNHGCERLDAAAESGGAMIVTNFARTGTEGDGHGYLRFARAAALLALRPAGALDVRGILRDFARDLGHPLIGQPGLADAAALPATRDLWIFGNDCIDRPSTAAAVVIEGRRPGDPESVATLWVIPGEPVCAVAVPLWVEAGESPEQLRSGEEAPLWTASLRLKSMIRPPDQGHRGDYLNLTRLVNADGTGFLPGLLAVEDGIFAATEDFQSAARTPTERAAFQAQMAGRALAALEAAGATR